MNVIVRALSSSPLRDALGGAHPTHQSIRLDRQTAERDPRESRRRRAREGGRKGAQRIHTYKRREVRCRNLSTDAAAAELLRKLMYGTTDLDGIARLAPAQHQGPQYEGCKAATHCSNKRKHGSMESAAVIEPKASPGESLDIESEGERKGV